VRICHIGCGCTKALEMLEDANKDVQFYKYREAEALKEAARCMAGWKEAQKGQLVVYRDNPEHYEKWKAAEKELIGVRNSRDAWKAEAEEGDRKLKEHQNASEAMARISTICNKYKGWR
jgi:hypothetical protein